MYHRGRLCTQEVRLEDPDDLTDSPRKEHKHVDCADLGTQFSEFTDFGGHAGSGRITLMGYWDADDPKTRSGYVAAPALLA